MSREKTVEEVRKEFLDHIRNLVNYWDKETRVNTKEKLEGLAFSILVTLDGCSSLPCFIVAPFTDDGDKQFHIDEDEDYYPQNNEANINCDIAGTLHELFYKE